MQVFCSVWEGMKLSRQVELISFQKNSFCLEIKQLPYGVVFSYSTNIFSSARRNLGNWLSVATQDMAKLGLKHYQSMEQLWRKELNGKWEREWCSGSLRERGTPQSQFYFMKTWLLQRYRYKKEIKNFRTLHMIRLLQQALNQHYFCFKKVIIIACYCSHSWL